jgi:dipeptide/tripeptide permease
MRRFLLAPGGPVVDCHFPLALLAKGNLMSVLRERVTVVWLGLMVLTCITTWGLSKDLFVPAVGVVGIFSIAAIKVSYVMLDFMELRYAPIPVRVAFQAWPVAVAAMILGFWFATTAIT